MDPIIELAPALLADRRRRLTDEIGRTRRRRVGRTWHRSPMPPAA